MEDKIDQGDLLTNDDTALALDSRYNSGPRDNRSEITLTDTPKAKFRFVIANEDSNASESEVQQRLETATAEAVNAARTELNTEATSELEGGFGGLGETVVILAIWRATEAGVAAFAKAVASEAGKAFYDNYLAPRLRKLNLLPAKFEEIRKKAPASKKKKKSSK